MQPSNEQVVASCQRAGIPYVCSVGNSICVSDYTVNPNDDTGPGSTLFIVAVLKAFKRDMFAFELRAIEVLDLVNGWAWRWQTINGAEEELDCPESTLTAACMAAIVAAYPAEEKA